MKRKAAWQRVTKGYIVETFKQPECKACEGLGYVGEEPRFSVCSCATLAFRRHADAEVIAGRFRLRKQRMGNRDVEWFERRDIGAI